MKGKIALQETETVLPVVSQIKLSGIKTIIYDDNDKKCDQEKIIGIGTYNALFYAQLKLSW